MKWTEVMRQLRAARFLDKRKAKARIDCSETGKEVWVTTHGHDAGNLGNRILSEAGVK